MPSDWTFNTAVANDDKQPKANSPYTFAGGSVEPTAPTTTASLEYAKLIKNAKDGRKTFSDLREGFIDSDAFKKAASAVLVGKDFDKNGFTYDEIEYVNQSVKQLRNKKRQKLLNLAGTTTPEEMMRIMDNTPGMTNDVLAAFFRYGIGDDETVKRLTGEASGKDLAKKIMKGLCEVTPTEDEWLKRIEDAPTDAQAKLVYGEWAASRGLQKVSGFSQQTGWGLTKNDAIQRIKRYKELTKGTVDNIAAIIEQNFSGDDKAIDDALSMIYMSPERRVEYEQDMMREDRERVLKLRDLASLIKAAQEGNVAGIFFGSICSSAGESVSDIGRMMNPDDSRVDLLKEELSKKVNSIAQQLYGKGGNRLEDIPEEEWGKVLTWWNELIKKSAEDVPYSPQMYRRGVATNDAKRERIVNDINALHTDDIKQLRRFYVQGYDIESKHFANATNKLLDIPKYKDSGQDFAARAGRIFGYMLPQIAIGSAVGFATGGAALPMFITEAAIWFPSLYQEAYEMSDEYFDASTPLEARRNAAIVAGWVNAVSQSLSVGVIFKGTGAIAKGVRSAFIHGVPQSAGRAGINMQRYGFLAFLKDSVSAETELFAAKYYKNGVAAVAAALARTGIRWGTDMTVEGMQEASEEIVKHAAREFFNAQIKDFEGKQAVNIDDVVEAMWENFKAAAVDGFPAMFILRGVHNVSNRMTGKPTMGQLGLVGATMKGAHEAKIIAALRHAVIHDNGKLNEEFVASFVDSPEASRDVDRKGKDYQDLTQTQKDNLETLSQIFDDIKKYDKEHETSYAAKWLKRLYGGEAIGSEYYSAKATTAAEKYFASQYMKMLIGQKLSAERKHLNSIRDAIASINKNPEEHEAKIKAAKENLARAKESRNLDIIASARRELDAVRNAKVRLEAARKIAEDNIAQFEKQFEQENKNLNDAFRELEGKSAIKYVRETSAKDPALRDDVVAFFRELAGSAEIEQGGILAGVARFFKDAFGITEEDLKEEQEEEPSATTEEKSTTAEAEATDDVTAEDVEEAAAEAQPSGEIEDQGMASAYTEGGEEGKERTERIIVQIIGKAIARIRKERDRKKTWAFSREDIESCFIAEGLDLRSITEERLNSIERAALLVAMLNAGKKRKNKAEREAIEDWDVNKELCAIDESEKILPTGNPVGGRGFGATLVNSVYLLSILRDTKAWTPFWKSFKQAIELYKEREYQVAAVDIRNLKDAITRNVLTCLTAGNGESLERFIGAYSLLNVLWTADEKYTKVYKDTLWRGAKKNQLTNVALCYALTYDGDAKLEELIDVVRKGNEADIGAVRALLFMEKQEEAVPEETQEEQSAEQAAVEEVEAQEEAAQEATEESPQETQEDVEENTEREEPQTEDTEALKKETPVKQKEFRRKSGNRGLHYAMQDGDIEWARRLLNKKISSGGANANSYDKGGYYQLHNAAHAGVDFVRLLLEHGAAESINKQTTWLGLGLTPLYIAANRGDIDSVKVLLAAGADPKIVCGNNGTAADAAERNGHTKVAEYIRSYERSDELPGLFMQFIRTGKIPEVGPAYNPRMVTPADTRTLRDTVRHWIKGVKVYVLNNAAFNAATARVNGAYILRDFSDTMGFYNAHTKEVFVRENSSINTILHELGWHATFDWARDNNVAMYEKLKEYASNAPERVKQFVREAYPEIDEDSTSWLNEVGAVFFSEQYAERMEQVFSDKESKSWLQKLRAFFTRAWRAMMRALGGNRVDIERLTKMHYNDMVAALAEEFAQGKTLGPIAERRRTAGLMETMFQRVGQEEAIDGTEDVSEDTLWTDYMNIIRSLVSNEKPQGSYADRVARDNEARKEVLKEMGEDMDSALAAINSAVRTRGKFSKPSMQRLGIPEFASERGQVFRWARNVATRLSELVNENRLNAIGRGKNKLLGNDLVAAYLKRILIPRYDSVARKMMTTKPYGKLRDVLDKMATLKTVGDIVNLAEISVEPVIAEASGQENILEKRRKKLRDQLSKYKKWDRKELEQDRGARALSEWFAHMAAWAMDKSPSAIRREMDKADNIIASTSENITDIRRVQAAITLSVLSYFQGKQFKDWDDATLIVFKKHLDETLSTGRDALAQSIAVNQRRIDAFFDVFGSAAIKAAENYREGITNIVRHLANSTMSFSERLDEATTYADVETQKEAREAIKRFSLELHDCYNKASAMFNKDNYELKKAIAKAYGYDFDADAGVVEKLFTRPAEFAKILADLYSPIEGTGKEYALASGDDLSKAQLINMYMTLIQPEIDGMFIDMTSEQIDALTGDSKRLYERWLKLDKLKDFLGPEMIELGMACSKIMHDHAAEIDEQTRKDCGTSLSYDKEGNYFPIVRDNVTYQQNVTVLGQTITIPGFLTKRVRSTKDIDEKADFISTFRRHSYDVAHYIHYGSTRPILRALLRDKRFEDVRKAIEQTQGRMGLHEIMEHGIQIHNGQLDGANLWAKATNVVATNAMTFARVMSLFFSFTSGLVQVFGSMAAPATTLGWSMTGEMFFNIIANPGEWAAEIKRLASLPEFKNRRGDLDMLLASQVARKTSGKFQSAISAKAAVALLEAERVGFSFVSWGDAVPVLAMGSSYSLMRRKDLIQAGMSEDAAIKQATLETFKMIDETQQSRDIQTRDTYMRDNNEIYKLCIQFRTSPSQYAAKEVRAWHDFLAHPSAETLTKYLSIAIHNHLVAPFTAAFARSIGNLVVAAMGGDDDDKSIMDIMNLQASQLVIGSLDSIPFIGWAGAWMSQTTLEMITGEKDTKYFQNRIVDLPTISAFQNLSRSAGSLASSINDGKEGSTAKEAKRLARNFAFYRQAAGMYNFFFPSQEDQSKGRWR